MLFPYGEWVILFLTLLTWIERRVSRHFFLTLTMAWLLGKSAEIVFAVATPWHWDLGRLAVMLVFWAWAFQRAEHRWLPLIFTSFIVGVETLFLVNEPGVFPYVSWAFGIVWFLVAGLSAKSYWGTAAALTGSALLNQAFIRFTFDGIIRYVELPNEFVWNLGVGLFTIWVGLDLALRGRFYFSSELQNAQAELVPSNTTETYQQSEETEL